MAMAAGIAHLNIASCCASAPKGDVLKRQRRAGHMAGQPEG
jgi:hypothetical protein